MSNISFNPALTTSPSGTFQIQTRGAVQGMFADDPASRPWLMQGQVYASVSMPLYGGLAIEELVPQAGADYGLGPIINLADTTAHITGFTVFNQGHNMLMAPGNLVPQSAGGMSIMFFRLGSNARIWVGVDANLAAAVDGNPINTQVQWDFSNNVLEAYSNSALAVKILQINTTCKTISVSGGLANWSTGACALIQI
jgi:hypothetical protein